MQNMYSVFPELRTWVTVNDIGADFMPLKVVAYKSFLSTPMLYPLFVNLKFSLQEERSFAGARKAIISIK